MDSRELQRRVAELLGFRVTERENDAVVEFYEEPLPEGREPKVRAVRPATREEVAMYLKLLGFVARMDEVVTENATLRDANNHLQTRTVDFSAESDSLLARAKRAERMAEELEIKGASLEGLVADLQSALTTARTQLRDCGEEIERLREENAELRTTMDENTILNNSLENENARLRRMAKEK